MARTEPQPPFSAAATTGAAADPFLDLGRLLSRLEQNILRADGDRWRRLVNDEFQRLQARFDVAAARTLLARVEQTAATVKGHARRQAVQAELGRRRTVVERLQERLDDLDEEARATAALEEDEEGDGSDSDDNDLSALDPSLAHILQQQLATAQRREPAAEAGAALGAGQETEPPPQAEQEETTTNSSRVGTSTSTPRTATAQSPPQATLRPRRSRRIAGKGAATPLSPPSRSASSKKTADTTTRAHTTATELQQDAARETKALRASLLGEDDAAGDGGGGRNAVANEEVALDHHRREQEALSEDILRLARALKEKSLATARLLEDDKDVVDRVGEGLHSTNETLAAASRGMAALTRMTEGKGWLGRLMLYGMVYGLMLVLVLLFLFLPKLRL